ncbi:hypothetical protein AB4254_08030 [Vibrio breoganii]
MYDMTNDTESLLIDKIEDSKVTRDFYVECENPLYELAEYLGRYENWAELRSHHKLQSIPSFLRLGDDVYYAFWDESTQAWYDCIYSKPLNVEPRHIAPDIGGLNTQGLYDFLSAKDELQIAKGKYFDESEEGLMVDGYAIVSHKRIDSLQIVHQRADALLLAIFAEHLTDALKHCGQ